VARVESKTVISTPNKLDTIPEPANGVQGQLGYWMSPEELSKKINELYPGCMKGQRPVYIGTV
jgi:phosphoenolpyruvate carboxykinase (GTP)